VQYRLLVVLVQTLRINPLLSSTAGFAAGGLTAYLLNHRYTFASDKSHLQAASRFAVVALFGMLLNAATMSIGVYVLALHYLLSQALATGFVLVWTYGANRYWTFR